MKQDIYSEALQAEAAKTPPAMDFVTVPGEIEVGVPVLFKMVLERDILNGTPALREWKCEWDFGDGSKRENGWAVFHYFCEAGRYPVTVKLHDIVAGMPITTLPARNVQIGGTRTGPQERLKWLSSVFPRAWNWFSPETKLEASRLMLVLAVAVIGLVAVAQQKVEGLTFLQAVGAVAALGFGADTLKNLVTQR
jgi:hypothetical protein